jgi:hypothetical protein
MEFIADNLDSSARGNTRNAIEMARDAARTCERAIKRPIAPMAWETARMI